MCGLSVWRVLARPTAPPPMSLATSPLPSANSPAACKSFIFAHLCLKLETTKSNSPHRGIFMFAMPRNRSRWAKLPCSSQIIWSPEHGDGDRFMSSDRHCYSANLTYTSVCLWLLRSISSSQLSAEPISAKTTSPFISLCRTLWLSLHLEFPCLAW